MAFLMSLLFTALWWGACAFLVALAAPEEGFPEPYMGLALTGGLFLFGMGKALWTNRRMARKGDLESFQAAEKRERRYQERAGYGGDSWPSSYGRRDDASWGFVLLLLFLIPQLAVDSFFEFLYTLADEEEGEVSPP